MAKSLTASLLAVLLAGSALASPAQQPSLEQLYESGQTFEQFLAEAERRRDAWHDHYGNGGPRPEAVARARALGAEVRLLVVAEDWCGDSVNTIPYLARLSEQVEGLELRVIDSEVGRAVMETRRTPDGRASTPTVVVLDRKGREVGHWVERPTDLQDWFLRSQTELRRRELYDRKYAWYAEDRGETTVSEIIDLIASATDGLAFTARPRTSGTDQLLQAISPVDADTVWASGHGGTWARSLDGGTSWHSGVVAGAEEMQFRDVEALDANTAWLMSAGTGDASRIYRTDDGGASWRLQFRNEEPTGFFDCLAFWDADRGLAFSDSIEGQTYLIRTDDGGETWERIPPHSLPAALDGEGSFAASGTCVTAGPNGRAWVATGAAATARVLFTRDWGSTWDAVETPAVAGQMSGLASVLFRNAYEGIALGGDIGAPDRHTDNVIVTADGGETWQLGGRPTFSGAAYGGAWVPGSRTVVATGPNGIDYSTDGGHSWSGIVGQSHWAVAFATDQVGWAVGPDGRITELRASRPSAAAQAATQDPVREAVITPERLLERIDAEEPMLILDVRTAEEFAEGHVPGAVNIPHTELAERLEEVRRAGTVDIVVYCRSGRRAGVAEELLAGEGFTRLLDLEGHMLGWVDKQLPVETGS